MAGFLFRYLTELFGGPPNPLKSTGLPSIAFHFESWSAVRMERITEFV